NIKHIYRSRDNRVIAGVMGGLGKYFGVDPVLLRLIFIFLFFATGIVPGIIAYIVAIFIVPKEPKDN
ncbi:MAG: PspC domain-containing protein, partial [Candidatus Magasanikbacteria bacterium]